MKKNPKKFVKKHKDRLKGGLADKNTPKDFDSEQLRIGIKVEMEHTKDEGIAREIAMDHLKEIPDYYTRLLRMESQAKKQTQKSQKNPKDFINKFKKSIDFNNTFSSIDARDQELAEKTACPRLLKLMNDTITAFNPIDGDITTRPVAIPLATGTLKISPKDRGLYTGFFEDTTGQVIEKFDNLTLELIAKNLQIKNLYFQPEVAEVVEQKEEPVIEPKEPYYIKVRCGDVEFEIRKSINDFVNSYKKSNSFSKSNIRKTINTWARNYAPKKFKDETQAARELSVNWEEHKEGFLQTLFAEEELKKSK